MSTSPESEHLRQFMEFDDDDPRFQVKILAMRIDNLTREKEKLEQNASDLTKRVADMERSFQRGGGILIVLPIFGTIIGLILAYGKVIFAPWLGGK